MPNHRRPLAIGAAAIMALALALPLGVAHAAEPTWPAWIDLRAGADVDEAYRARFDLCDQVDGRSGETFEGRRGCAGDPNRVTALRRLPGGAISYVSKLAVDLDGSALACSPDKGRQDQCDTTLEPLDAAGEAQPVDSDRVPYVVIPAAGPDEHRGEFSRLTGVHVGDFGVVIWRGRTVPVIVADTGPYHLLGEGSLALHTALGHEQCRDRDEAGVCRGGSDRMQSIDEDVVTVLFPGSAKPGLTGEDLPAVVEREGARLWAGYRSQVSVSPKPAGND